LKKYSFEKNKNFYFSDTKNLIKLRDDINYPPFHYLVEDLTLGNLIHFLSVLEIENKSILKKVSKKFNFFNEKVFISYLLRLKETRNRVAHHSRIFNRNYRSVKAINNNYRNIRKTIYDHRLLDVYYSLLILLDKNKNITNTDELELIFKKNLAGMNLKVENIIIKCVKK
jgi:abortive infection bacteriophage resistance protein